LTILAKTAREIREAMRCGDRVRDNSADVSGKTP
jgi:hypothetical protein